MNVVIYARFSCDNQREESIDGQLRECMSYAEKKGMTVIEKYIDRAVSAKTDNRPEFQKMISDSFKKEFSAVLVWKLDRFSRNRYDSAKYKIILKKNQVKVISATENISEGAEGIILEAVLEGVAEYYSAELSEKVIRGMKENVINGKFNGGNVPIGYYIDSNKHFQINEKEAKFIQTAFEMYASGISIKEICKYLNCNNVKNCSGTDIKTNSISKMLRNRKYIGEYVMHDIVSENFIPAIISKDLFDIVQERIESKKKYIKRDINNYILSGLVRCSICGRDMVGESGTSKTGVIYYYYKCQSVKRHLGCTMKSPHQDVLENYVFQRIINFLTSEECFSKISKKILKINKNENATLKLLKKHQCDIDFRIKNIINAISFGICSQSVKTELDNLESQKAVAEEKISKEKNNLSRKKLTSKKIKYWLENRCYFLSSEKKAMIVHAVVEEIIYTEGSF